MSIFDAIILAIVEGLTEFLPISSTGHMIIVGDWLGVENTSTNKAFEVIIQVAAMLAVIANYKERFHPKYYFTLWVNVLIAFLPIALVGFFFNDFLETLLERPEIVAVMFIVGGIIFIWIERVYKEENCPTTDVADVTRKQAFWIGFAQLFAAIPGTSRAGASIVGAMLTGLNRKASAEFSFLLGVPVLASASGYAFLKHYQDFTTADLTNLAIGFVVAFLVAYFVIKWFIRFLANSTFVGFGIYRIIFGVILLATIWS